MNWIGQFCPTTLLVEISYLPNVVAVAPAATAAAGGVAPVLPGLVLEVPPRLRLHGVVPPPAVRLVGRAGGHPERGRGTVLVLQINQNCWRNCMCSREWKKEQVGLG